MSATKQSSDEDSNKNETTLQRMKDWLIANENSIALALCLTAILLITHDLIQRHMDNAYAIELKKLELEQSRIAIEQQRLSLEIDKQKQAQEADSAEAGLVTIRNTLVDAKSNPSKLGSILNTASDLVDALVKRGQIMASEGSDIKKVLIEKGIGGGIDEAIKIVDKLLNKYLGLSDDEAKTKDSDSNVTVNVYCSGQNQSKSNVVRHTPKKMECGKAEPPLRDK